mgnify:CR=1 FL=1
MSKFQEAMRNPKLSNIARKAMCECAYACLGMALFEGPHVSLEYDPIAHTEIPWDFYDERPEGRNGQWLMQLVTLFRDGYMDSSNPDLGRYVLPPGKREQVTEDIANNFEFRMYSPYAYMEASQEIKDLVDRWVPAEILEVLHEQRKPRPTA